MNDPDTLRANIERLCVKHDATLGNMRRPHLQLTLCLAALTIPPAAAFSEPQVNDALRQWLAGTGAMLRIDHVELRRQLVDSDLWRRDGFGRQYERAASIANEELGTVMDSLVDVDVAFIVENARRQHSQEREARRARHEPGNHRASG